MKRNLLFLSLLLCIVSLRAQNTNLIFFTEQGERFSVVLNGVLQNEVPLTNIKVADLPAPSYKLKIIFENQKIADLNKTIFLKQGTETTYAIRKNKKNLYVLRYMNEVPIAQAPVVPPAQQVIIYHPEPVKPVSTSSTTTTTTTTTSAPGNAGVGININDPYSGGGINVNMNMGGSGSQTTTTTTTTTTSSGNDGHGYRDDRHDDHRDGRYEDQRDGRRDDYRDDRRDDRRDDYRDDRRDDRRDDYNEDRRDDHRHNGDNERKYVLPGYTGVYGCPWPMSPTDFEQAKQSISSKTFEDSKLTIAKQIINTNCLLSTQVKEIMLLFTYETTRLELAKFAYGHTLDISNYYKVNDAFTYESSIDELNEYTAGFKR